MSENGKAKDFPKRLLRGKINRFSLCFPFQNAVKTTTPAKIPIYLMYV
jgi:hypothetical protein